MRVSESTFLPTRVLIEMLFTYSHSSPVAKIKCWYGAYLQTEDMLKVPNQHFRFVDVVPITSV